MAMSSGIGLALMQLASVPGLPYPPCGALAAALGQMTQPKAAVAAKAAPIASIACCMCREELMT